MKNRWTDKREPQNPSSLKNCWGTDVEPVNGQKGTTES